MSFATRIIRYILTLIQKHYKVYSGYNLIKIT
jgi:hypothetical protein